MEGPDTIVWSSDKLMEFAEVLYKCTLCTTLPSILTSKVNFLNHMNDSHVGTKASLCGCRQCNLNFDLEEDLKAHMEMAHPWVVTRGDSFEQGRDDADRGPHDKADSPGNSIEPFACDNEDFVSTKDDENTALLTVKRVQNAVKGRDIVATEETKAGVAEGRMNPISPNFISCRSKRKRSMPVAHRGSSSKSDKLTFTQKFLTFHTDTADTVTSSDTSQRPMPDVDFSTSESDPCSLSNWEVSPPPHQSLKMKFHKREMKHDPSKKSIYTCMSMSEGMQTTCENAKQVDKDADSKNKSGDRESNSEERAVDIRGKSHTLPNLDQTFGDGIFDSDVKVQSVSIGTLLAPRNTVASTGMHQCFHCSYQFSNFQDYASHCAEVHDVLDMTLPDSQQVSMGEGEKANRIKEHLPALLCSCPGNCVSRDVLLEQLSEQIPNEDILQWGPACNKAVREIFSNSQAVRKGKYKRTFYLGVKLLLGPPSTGDMEMEEEEEATSNMVLRDMAQHTELIAQVLPDMVRWTGHMDSCMTRDSLLHTISVHCGNPDILTWGVECNRAVRQLFPAMYLKRKGKYKTCFYGMELVAKPPCESLNEGKQVASRGPPVVNAMDIMETPGHAHFSKLKPAVNPSQQTHHQSQLEPTGSNLKVKAELSDEHSSDREHVIAKDSPGDGELNYAHTKGTCPQNAVSPSQSKVPVPNFPDANPRSLEKLILLHPGPFILARIINRRFQRCVPHINLVINAMTLLQSYGLGKVFTVLHGNSKVFFKALPSRSIEPSLSLLGVRLTDYHVMFRERDPKLEDYTHDKVKLHYPELHLLPAFYKY